MTDALAVVPSDTTDLAKGVTKGIFVGVSGDVRVDLSSGTIITLKGLAAGVIHPIAVKRVYATNTTALEIVGVY
ncbi:hypothetical protein [Bacillus sp. OK048]|uniref:spike base protein, RCAP_Rcc01079 family n=1 Tax=Bacillus sp. OK048 TaxID=1882761 RepID=UPI000886E424|nr:hypothetical protein [Bacillus sp. OK048]SDM23041.1 hypothetical protein SAMN05443253_102385 [Bacillus sp. OK048]